MSVPVVIVQINDGSDGDASHQPGSSSHTLVDPPILYLEKIALSWMQERGEARKGVLYRLDRLPDGYSMWQKPRVKDPKHCDKWLYGHPRGKWFDSPNRFFPHFLHLMESGGSNVGCPCTVCVGPKGVLGGKQRAPNGSTNGSDTSHTRAKTVQTTTTTTSEYFGKPRGRKPKVDFGRTNQIDDEGTPDVYRNLIDELKVRGTLDESIEERLSMDWRAERPSSPNALHELNSKPSWIPRIGEVVLYVRDLFSGESIRYDEDQKIYRSYLAAQGHFLRSVKWEAGVITQVPQHDLQLEEILEGAENQEFQVNYSGFRIEHIPDVNYKGKSGLGLQKYVYLHQIRPFVFWKELLAYVPEHAYDPSIFNAIAYMSSFSLVEKYRFKGVWPNASIFCKALYLSSELLAVGDVVRLLPVQPEDKVTEVLHIRSIQLSLTGLDQASSNDYDDGHPYNSTVFLFGAAYVLDQDADELSPDLPRQLLGSGNWSMKHDSSKQMKISFNRVLGRFFEMEAMGQWFPEPSVSDGLDGMVAARKRARLDEPRIESGKQWLWAETRTEALNLKTFNGQEIAIFDPERDPKEMRKYLKIMDGVAGEQERQAIKEKVSAQRSLRNFGMFAYNPPDAAQETDDATGSGQGSGLHSRKRSRSAMSTSSGGRRASGMGFQVDGADDRDAEGDDDEGEDKDTDGDTTMMAEDHTFKRQRTDSESSLQFEV